MSAALDSALSAMRASQAQIAVASHNVANAGVEGYTRQRIQVSANAVAFRANTMIGGGVQTGLVQQVSNRWLDRHIYLQMRDQSYYDSLHTRLGEVETVFNESTNEGIGRALSDFFSGLSSVTSRPEDAGGRLAAVNAAQQLASRLQRADRQLNTIQHETRLELDYRITAVNDQLRQVATLNGKISSGIKLGYNVADLQDERSRVLGALAESIGAESYFSDDGGVSTVTIGGKNVVSETVAETLDVNNSGVGIAGQAARFAVDKGEIGAMLAVRDEVVPRYKADLDQLAATLIGAVNTVHADGYALDGSTGRDLFTGTDASDIAVNTAIVNDPSLLGASATGAPGDGQQAQALLNLRSAAQIGTLSFEEFHQSIVGAVGAETASAESYSASVDEIVEQLQLRREGITGVSVDEEMASLIRFQQAYNAAARVVSMVDQMMDTTLNIGR